jgi:protein SCO1/2
MKKIYCLLILFTLPVLAMAQTPDFVKSDEKIEIGVVEKLGDTIPLDLAFLNEQNQEVTLRQLINKPTILSFVYFDCPGLCSPLLNGVSEMVSKLDMNLGKDYQIITISFNTQDTPEKAIEKKKNFVQKISKENQDDWIYLTGSQENINLITAAAGYNYVPQGVDFAHPSVIIVLSPSGKITRYLYGLVYLPFDVKMAIIEAQKGISRPSINKVLEYCFAYNPTSKSYTLQVTRIVGILILLCAVLILVPLIIRSKLKSKPIK